MATVTEPGEFPCEDRFRAHLGETADAGIEPTGIDSSVYLDVAERIARVAAGWVDESGRIVDPNTGDEWAHTSPRYASSVAPLIAAGRCEDLLDSCVLCLDASCRRLAEGSGSAFDFWPRDLALAVHCLEGRIAPERLAAWKELLGAYDPQERYQYVTSKKAAAEIHNWAVYALTGEQMKRRIGAADGIAFIEEHLQTQRERFTALGMYRDPNCPVTYDLSVRQNLVLLLTYGYDGRHHGFVDEMLRRGGLTQLFFQSTTGEMPFGGRSNQFHHVEAMSACTAEFEARRYAALGDMRLAGAFKRSARRAAASTLRWLLDAEPFRHVKNMFGPDTLHGCDSYGQVSAYGLLAANLFAVAARIADDSIAERAAPCDAGGCVVPILEDFHRVFASCGPLHVEIDTRGQQHFDATGLARLHCRGLPSELALSGGIVPDPKYRTAEPAHSEAVAIGPCSQAGGSWRALAGAGPDGASVEVVEEGLSRVEFRVRYECDGPVVEDYVLTPGALELTASAGGGPVRVTVPLILTDGEAESRVRVEPRAFVVSYRGAEYRAEALGEHATAGRLGVRAPNRNAIYDVGFFAHDGGEAGGLTVRFTFR